MKNIMLTVYVTRHGETEWNKEKRMQGHLDSDLTGKGKPEALLLGEKLKDINFKRINSWQSDIPYGRAGKRKKPVPIETDKRLWRLI
ncbi:hypothetical protein GCM10009865_41310 [Aeromicrobium ponti]|uniref:Putative phosphoglycerate mutase n=1 Tax=Cytobacillus oceanisediminis TaxID=665099 RepID=A0A562JIG8_9BACI|nr:histidine phosphatase family protein [Cytobacillus oceanisediminis]TWH82976.1 putative phosphoglycerate mutase [Cytobacillus oceanisediminis]